MIKRYGDSGSPCHMPLVGVKYSVGFPLIKIEVDVVVMQDIINLIKFGGKFKVIKEL